MHDLRALQRGEHRRIAGQQRAHIHIMRLKGQRQRTGHIGQPTGFDQRIKLGGDRENFERFHRLKTFYWHEKYPLPPGEGEGEGKL